MPSKSHKRKRRIGSIFFLFFLLCSYSSADPTKDLRGRKRQGNIRRKGRVSREGENAIKKTRRKNKTRRFRKNTRGLKALQLEGNNLELEQDNIFLARDRYKNNKRTTSNQSTGTQIRGERSTEIASSTEIVSTYQSRKKETGFLDSLFDSSLAGWAALGTTTVVGAGVGTVVGAAGVSTILCAVGSICGNQETGASPTSPTASPSEVVTQGGLRFTLAASRIPTQTEIDGIVEQIGWFYISVLASAFPSNFKSFTTEERSATSVVSGTTTTSLLSFNAISIFSEATARIYRESSSIPPVASVQQAIHNADLNIFRMFYIPNATPYDSIFRSTASVVDITLLTTPTPTPPPTSATTPSPTTGVPADEQTTYAPAPTDKPTHVSTPTDNPNPITGNPTTSNPAPVATARITGSPASPMPTTIAPTTFAPRTPAPAAVEAHTPKPVTTTPTNDENFDFSDHDDDKENFDFGVVGDDDFPSHSGDKDSEDFSFGTGPD